ncbi:hypothetical protein ABT169_21515 [Streptomyces sp. NPDC001616]|uniref:hypothetical protein n=1 Tax=Streptomyces sp. NPDC001616 TaxID=3156648 RepID=UPI003318E4BC
MASNEETPRVGSVWRDTSRDHGQGEVGQVMECDHSRVYMRPIGGGVEWRTRREYLEPVKKRAEQ